MVGHSLWLCMLLRSGLDDSVCDNLRRMARACCCWQLLWSEQGQWPGTIQGAVQPLEPGAGGGAGTGEALLHARAALALAQEQDGGLVLLHRRNDVRGWDAPAAVRGYLLHLGCVPPAEHPVRPSDRQPPGHSTELCLREGGRCGQSYHLPVKQPAAMISVRGTLSHLSQHPAH